MRFVVLCIVVLCIRTTVFRSTQTDGVGRSATDFSGYIDIQSHDGLDTTGDGDDTVDGIVIGCWVRMPCADLSF